LLVGGTRSFELISIVIFGKKVFQVHFKCYFWKEGFLSSFQFLIRMYFSDRLLDVVGAARNKAEKIEEMERYEFLSIGNEIQKKANERYSRC
jgi:hypothetical protein